MVQFVALARAVAPVVAAGIGALIVAGIFLGVAMGCWALIGLIDAQGRGGDHVSGARS